MLDKSLIINSGSILLWLSLFTTIILSSNAGWSQQDTIVIGFGEYQPNTITASSEDSPAENTINQDGFLPNKNAASRFLAQATLGYNFEDIDDVTEKGIEDWIDEQFDEPMLFSFIDKVQEYHQYRRDSLMDPEASPIIRFFDYAWWQYHMKSEDYLRQRVALALSEIIVISRLSNFGGTPYPFANYMDILLENAFGNYKDLIEDITYQPAMGRYLTYLNNPKSDTTKNQFPDENYARELMQLFTIGLYELNNDGSIELDVNEDPIPSYSNVDIVEFSKVFTGLSWGDRPTFGKYYPLADSSYYLPMKMFNDEHEPGVKYLLNGDSIINRIPVDGDADIQDALDNLFEHQNLAPFVSKLLIQRLVTSNPSPEYISRVVAKFNNNGNGEKGDMKAIIKAILLDPEAKSCNSAANNDFGMLREPFVRYVQINKAFYASTPSGNFRNDMDYIYRYTQQKPFTSPSVFNFFQPDYQPIGPVNEADKVAPEFQIVNTQTLTGFINGVNRWIMKNNPADEYSLFSGESSETINQDLVSLNFDNLKENATYDKVHILLDELNLLLAQGRLSDPTIDFIKEVVLEYDGFTDEQRIERVKVAAYLLLTSPEYLINR